MFHPSLPPSTLPQTPTSFHPYPPHLPIKKPIISYTPLKTAGSLHSNSHGLTPIRTPSSSTLTQRIQRACAHSAFTTSTRCCFVWKIPIFGSSGRKREVLGPYWWFLVARLGFLGFERWGLEVERWRWVSR